MRDRAVEVAEFALKWLQIKNPYNGPTEDVWEHFIRGIRAIIQSKELPEDIKKTLKGN